MMHDRQEKTFEKNLEKDIEKTRISLKKISTHEFVCEPDADCGSGEMVEETPPISVQGIIHRSRKT